MQKAVNQYDKDFVKSKQDEIVDTLSTSMFNIKFILDDLVKQIQDKSDLISRDLIEPLDLYYKHYSMTNHELLKQAGFFWNNLHSDRTQMLFAKESYHNTQYQMQQVQLQYSEMASNAFGSNSNSPDKRNMMTSRQSNTGSNDDAYIGIQDKKLQSHQIKVDIARNEYERCLNKLNLTIDMFDIQYKPILNRIQEGDDAQINFMKYNMEKFARYLEQMGKDMRSRGEDICQTIGMVSSETDLRIFIDTNKSQNQFIQRVPYDEFEQESSSKYKTKYARESKEITFEISTVKSSFIDENYIQNSLNDTNLTTAGSQGNQNYQTSNARIRGVSGNDHDFQMIDPLDQQNKDKILLEEQMNKLLKSQQISIEEKGKLIQLMHNKFLRSAMRDILKDINSPRQLSNNECLKLIADIIKFILTLFVHEQSNDYRLVYNILESSQNIYTQINKRKVFLSSLLCDHGIWQDVKIWREMIVEIVEQKMIDSSRLRKRKEKILESQNSGKDKNIFKKGFKSLKGMLQTKEAKQMQEIKINQNLIFNELSRFISFFINFGLAYEQANDILISYCESFQLDSGRIHILLTELQSNQKNTASMFTEKEQLIWSLQKRGNRFKNFGFSEQCQILGMTIKFIDSDVTLRNLLMLSRDYYEMLQQEILKQALLRSQQERLKNKRKVLWLKILNIDPQYVQAEFEGYYQTSLLELQKSVSDAIDVDVSRSFNNLKQITPENLNHILKTYAIINPNLDYCQGMNFIAGFLYLLFQKESLAFAVMREIIAKYQMSQLFNTELPMLKLTFYQLDRLISIKLPDLHAHFKDETINSSYFSSPYFITLFTNVLQMQTSFDNSAILLRLWEYFIIYGWKAIFKVSLLILRENEEKLLTMPFEIMLSQIINLPQKFLVQQFKSEEEEREGIKTFDKQLKDFKIPTMLMERLKTEFDQNYKISLQSSNNNSDSNNSGYSRMSR
eukprot:403354306